MKQGLDLECEEKLCSSLQEDLESNSPESRMEKVLDGLGNNEVENEKGVLINAESCVTPNAGGMPGTPSEVLDDGSPPVIEFTPEFYHLVNYGSNLSVSDNEHSPTHGNKKSTKIGALRSAKWVSGKMDDKVSQTDFSSSLENLSVSSELFTECRNCLELIKKLVGNGGEENTSSTTSLSLGGTTLHRDRIHEREELQTDLGSPTAWISVPKGLPTNEVNQILDILSSSESEDVLTQTK
jgi:CCR4-NOT transcriptional regulation complex NOT5 subunit